MKEGVDYPIIHGPEYFDLCESLKYSCTAMSHHHSVDFSFTNPPESHVQGYFKIVVQNLVAKSEREFWVEGIAFDPSYADGKRIRISYNPSSKSGSACII